MVKIKLFIACLFSRKYKYNTQKVLSNAGIKGAEAGTKLKKLVLSHDDHNTRYK